MLPYYSTIHLNSIYRSMIPRFIQLSYGTHLIQSRGLVTITLLNTDTLTTHTMHINCVGFNGDEKIPGGSSRSNTHRCQAVSLDALLSHREQCNPASQSISLSFAFDHHKRNATD